MSKCKVMGIVNVTPDSFSDGGQFYRPEEAIRRAMNLVEDGADIIDLGGESTRPGSTPLGWEEEWRRIEPVLRGLSPLLMGTVPSPNGDCPRSKGGTVPISVDTYHPEPAERAVALGATIVNCVYAEPIPKMYDICAKSGAELVIPTSAMGTVPIETGTVPIYLDPMIGFGTTRDEDLELLRSVPELAKRGRVLVGASRKRIVKKLTGEKVTGKNLGGNLGIAVWCAMNGASVVRVHDVKETVQALRVVEAIESAALP